MAIKTQNVAKGIPKTLQVVTCSYISRSYFKKSEFMKSESATFFQLYFPNFIFQVH